GGIKGYQSAQQIDADTTRVQVSDEKGGLLDAQLIVQKTLSTYIITNFLVDDAKGVVTATVLSTDTVTRTSANVTKSSSKDASGKLISETVSTRGANGLTNSKTTLYNLEGGIKGYQSAQQIDADTTRVQVSDEKGGLLDAQLIVQKTLSTSIITNFLVDDAKGVVTTTVLSTDTVTRTSANVTKSSSKDAAGKLISETVSTRGANGLTNSKTTLYNLEGGIKGYQSAQQIDADTTRVQVSDEKGGLLDAQLIVQKTLSTYIITNFLVDDAKGVVTATVLSTDTVTRTSANVTKSSSKDASGKLISETVSTRGANGLTNSKTTLYNLEGGIKGYQSAQQIDADTTRVQVSDEKGGLLDAQLIVQKTLSTSIITNFLVDDAKGVVTTTVLSTDTVTRTSANVTKSSSKDAAGKLISETVSTRGANGLTNSKTTLYNLEGGIKGYQSAQQIDADTTRVQVSDEKGGLLDAQLIVQKTLSTYIITNFLVDDAKGVVTATVLSTDTVTRTSANVTKSSSKDASGKLISETVSTRGANGLTNSKTTLYNLEGGIKGYQSAQQIDADTTRVQVSDEKGGLLDAQLIVQKTLSTSIITNFLVDDAKGVVTTTVLSTDTVTRTSANVTKSSSKDASGKLISETVSTRGANGLTNSKTTLYNLEGGIKGYQSAQQIDADTTRVQVSDEKGGLLDAQLIVQKTLSTSIITNFLVDD